MKVVINRCFGGFGLSDVGYKYYAKLKGLTLYPETDPKYKSLDMTTYWTVPPNERPKEIVDWARAPIEERTAYNDAYTKSVLYCRDIPRNDPLLARTVEDLGSEIASGRFAELCVVEIPDGIDYEIDEYDGLESIHETHRSWR